MKKLLSLVLALLLLCSLTLPAAAAGETTVFRGSQTDPSGREVIAACAAAMAEAAWPVLEGVGGSGTKTVFQYSSSDNMNLMLKTMGEAGLSSGSTEYAILFFDKVLPICYDQLLAVQMEEYDVPWHYTEFTQDGHFRKNGEGPVRETWLMEAHFDPAEDGADLLAALQGIAAEARAASETDRGRLQYINRWLIDHVSYGRPEKYLLETRSDGTKVYSSNGGQSVRELLEEGLAVCAGYTHTVSYLCFMLGIPNVELCTDDHTWNLVLVEGEWRMLDVTWNDTTGGEEQYFLTGEIDDKDHAWTAWESRETVEAAKTMAAAAQERLALLRSLGASRISVRVGEEKVGWTDALPFIDENDRTLVPLRAVANALGLSVSWDASAREAVFSKNGRTIRFPIGNQTAFTTEGVLQMDTAAIIRNDRTYAPIRYLAEYFGSTVGWDAAARTVLIG